MASLRLVLLLAGLVLIAGIFLYSRGWFARFSIRKFLPAKSADPAADPEESVADEEQSQPVTPVRRTPELPPLRPDSKIVAVRIVPQAGESFPAEELVLALRAAGMQHGAFGIFHRYGSDANQTIRFSIATLVEPGSFDLANLKESEYEGVSVFLVLPNCEDGVAVFDEMITTARGIARSLGGQLIDVEGGAFSLQRERYMREEIIEFMRRLEMDEQLHRYSDTG